MTFQDIMDYSKPNKQVFDNLLRAMGNVVPFVGAGLSVPAGYPQWGGVLQHLTDLVDSSDDQASIQDCINRGDSIQAAGLLAEALGNLTICSALTSLLDPDKLDVQKLNGTAAAALPWVFPDGYVLTTNYDHVLEAVYHKYGRDFYDSILPYRAELARASNQSNAHILLKLHGEVSHGLTEWGSIVFTKQQYDAAYGPGLPVAQRLQEICAAHPLLFLGCSLYTDRTVDFLELTAQPGIQHFAILPCKKQDLTQRRRVLCDKLHMQPIFYPENQHEAVRLILCELLRRHDPSGYQVFQAHFENSHRPSSPFVYNAERIDFFGRTQQLDQLEAFCTRPEPVLWWGITGPGGSGKSRLAYEFCKRKQAQGWRIHYLNPQDYSRLDTLSLGPRSLVVADYVQGHTQSICTWLQSLPARCAGYTVRVLLLERDDTALNSLLSSPAFAMAHYQSVRDFCFQPDSMQLTALSQDDLMDLMDSYYTKVLQRPPLSELVRQQLYTALEQVDKGLLRPLYALFLTDSYADDPDQDPCHWDTARILDKIYNKELGYLNEKIRDITASDADTSILSPWFQALVAVSTLYDGISEAALQKYCPAFWNKFKEKLPRTMQDSVHTFLKRMGTGRDTGGNFSLFPIKPDLLGEYFVLRTLSQQEVPDAWPALVHPLFTQFDQPQVLFFTFRLVTDYPQLVTELDWFYRSLLHFQPNSRNCALVYGIVLVNLSCNQLPENTEHTVQTLKELHNHYPTDSQIALRYAMGLVNLINKQPPEWAEHTVHILKDLHNHYPTDSQITLHYAKGLVNLTNKQPPDLAEHTVQTLKELHNDHPTDSQITLHYAIGLVNLSEKQEPAEISLHLAELETLHRAFPTDPDFSALRYAVRIFLFRKQGKTDAAKQASRNLTALHQQYPENKIIAQAHQLYASLA